MQYQSEVSFALTSFKTPYYGQHPNVLRNSNNKIQKFKTIEEQGLKKFEKTHFQLDKNHNLKSFKRAPKILIWTST